MMLRLKDGSTYYCQDDVHFDALLLMEWRISLSRAKTPCAIRFGCLRDLDEAPFVR